MNLSYSHTVFLVNSFLLQCKSSLNIMLEWILTIFTLLLWRSLSEQASHYLWSWLVLSHTTCAQRLGLLWWIKLKWCYARFGTSPWNGPGSCSFFLGTQMPHREEAQAAVWRSSCRKRRTEASSQKPPPSLVNHLNGFFFLFLYVSFFKKIIYFNWRLITVL